MPTRKLYVHDDCSMWVVVTETEEGFLHEFGDGDCLVFDDPPPEEAWRLLAQHAITPPGDPDD